MKTLGRLSFVRILGAFLLPFAIQAVPTLVLYAMGVQNHGMGRFLWQGFLLASAVTGLLVITPLFRAYTLVIAIPYLPVMYAVLFWYSAFLIGVITGDSL